MATKKVKETGKQAGLGNIDTRLAEIRDTIAAPFYNQFIIVTFLLLYLEVLDGVLEHLRNKDTLEWEDVETFNEISGTISSQDSFYGLYFYNKHKEVLEKYRANREGEIVSDALYSDFCNAFESLFSGQENQFPNLTKQQKTAVLNSRKNLIRDVEKRIIFRFRFAPSKSSPTYRLILGIILMVYLEVLKGFGRQVRTNKNNLSDFNSAAEAIRQEYLYSLHGELLSEEVIAEKFRNACKDLLASDSDLFNRVELIDQVEREIFYSLTPLVRQDHQ